MPIYSRRQLLQILASAFAPMALRVSQEKNMFTDERACVHVFDPKKELPSPLLHRPDAVPNRSPSGIYFHAGLSELVLCVGPAKLLDIFPYFWPVSESEMQQMKESMSVLFDRPRITRAQDIKDLGSSVAHHRSSVRTRGSSTAVLLTYNAYTRYWSRAVIEVCKNADVDELLIFKDPTKEPYLCDYPSRQKGFKKPPP